MNKFYLHKCVCGQSTAFDKEDEKNEIRICACERKYELDLTTGEQKNKVEEFEIKYFDLGGTIYKLNKDRLFYWSPIELDWSKVFWMNDIQEKVKKMKELSYAEASAINYNIKP